MNCFCLSIGFCVSLISCVATNPVASPAGAGPEEIDAVAALTERGELMQNVGEVSSDPSTTELPLMRAVGAGAPKYEIMADGSYIATYRYGKKRYFKIIGTRRNLSAKSYAPHSTMKLMDQVIPSYGTGNEDPEYTSQDRTFVKQDGWANFVFIHGGNRDFNTGKQIENDLPKVIW
jgi:hypothetical protein